MIQQHFYTRERRGLYKPSAGYDTIAKSRGLTDDFVKGKIHPYCVFSGGVSGVSEAITLAHFPCGRMLFGQAVFVPADFTGQRAAFFMHNFVLEAAAVGAALADMEKLLNTRFETAYDVSEGREPEEVECLPAQTCGNFPPEPSGAGEGTIAHIVNCVIESVEKSKKTYVILPQEVLQKHDYTRALLVKIYESLPECVKHILGFCTYSREPEKRKNIHLVFLESEAYRAGVPRFSGNFIVDLNEKKYDELKLNENINENYTYEAFLSKKILSLTPAQFFTECDFWRARDVCDMISRLEGEWLDKNLEKLTAQNFFSAPDNFIKKRKNGENAAVFVIFSIVKVVCGNLMSKKTFSLRYLLGSYKLSAENHARTVKILKKIYEEFHISPEDEGDWFFI